MSKSFQNSRDKTLLMRYVKLVIEGQDMARVPTQLLPPDDADGKEDKSDKEEDGNEVQEFSAAGAVAGYTLPLGMSPDKAGRHKNRPKRK